MSTTDFEHLQTQQPSMYTFLVDDREFEVNTTTITCGEIMEKAGIPREAGLILLLEDGTQRTVSIDEIISVQTSHHFKKAPRFKRGRR
jgi:hypothetical protein